MKIQANISIKDKHSFHCPVQTRYWVEYESVEELKAVLKDAAGFGMPVMSIGAGCNMLFSNDYPGILLHSQMREITIGKEDETGVELRVGAGVCWDDLVVYAVERGWGGLENLSGIPGDVGASVVQNIGAYGAEAKEVIVRVEVLNRQTLETSSIDVSACELAYRSSRFKRDWKEVYVVCAVHFRLQKQPQYRIAYRSLEERISRMGGLQAQANPLQCIRDCVLSIRREKLPDPNQLGNAGSFFVNPEVEKACYEALAASYPDMPAWPADTGKIKLSAAWLIEQCGWKGRSMGNAAVYDKQPLVLVNTGQAESQEIIALYKAVASDVKKRFQIDLKPEVFIL